MMGGDAETTASEPRDKSDPSFWIRGTQHATTGTHTTQNIPGAKNKENKITYLRDGGWSVVGSYFDDAQTDAVVFRD